MTQKEIQRRIAHLEKAGDHESANVLRQLSQRVDELEKPLKLERAAEQRKREKEKQQKETGYYVKGSECKNAHFTKDCGHFDGKKIVRPGFYPVFNIGTSKPFSILLALCPDCAKRATVHNILTDDRWSRMQKILEYNGEKVPDRATVTMQIEQAVMRKNDYEDYAYALAC